MLHWRGNERGRLGITPPLYMLKNALTHTPIAWEVSHTLIVSNSEQIRESIRKYLS